MKFVVSKLMSLIANTGYSRQVTLLLEISLLKRNLDNVATLYSSGYGLVANYKFQFT